jgi:hypothetical protein
MAVSYTLQRCVEGFYLTGIFVFCLFLTGACALSTADFDPYTPNSNPNRNILCGSTIVISYEGRTASCTVLDL